MLFRKVRTRKDVAADIAACKRLHNNAARDPLFQKQLAQKIRKLEQEQTFLRGI